MLSVENLDVSYGQSKIIHGMSIHAAPGEIVAIMGRNGMGKSTLFKSLIGIVPSTRGSVKIGGEPIERLESFERVKRGLAYVPQGRAIFSTLTVKENIETGLTVTGETRIPDAIYGLFPVLREMKGRRGGNLSGGQQQQLAIARALAARPQVLLLDEPTEGIQPSVIKEIARTLCRIRDEMKLTIVVSEQVLSFALAIADRVLAIEKGTIVHESPRVGIDEAKIAKFLSV